MNRTLVSIAVAALIASFGSAYAQSSAPGDAAAAPAGKPGPARAEHHLDCSKAKAPEKCEERHKEMRAHFEEAKKACEGKQGDEHRACMTDAMCAKAPNPEKCQERAKKGAERFKQMKQACGDKQGDELRACMREQHKNAMPAK